MNNLTVVFLALVLSLQTPAKSTVARMSLHAPKAQLTVEIADTEAKRQVGLMNRTQIAPKTGMIFVFERDALVEFWMKNTLVPLDMVFVSEQGRVRVLWANVPAATLQTPDDRVARRSGFAKYVIELRAGEAAADGLKPGALIPELRH
ncbi:MAG: hypothetical protein NVS9B12_08130 [Vulcanimicrobiaceae bacterium]